MDMKVNGIIDLSKKQRSAFLWCTKTKGSCTDKKKGHVYFAMENWSMDTHTPHRHPQR